MRQSHKFLATIDSSFYRRYLQQILMIVGFILFSLVSEPVFANLFANNIPASGPNACPANHKMYYIGATPPTSTLTLPVTSQPLNWTAGETERKFTFTEASGNKEFIITFPILLDLNNSLGTPPFYGSLNGITTNAINLDHDSPAVKNNHSMNVSVNRSVSKVSYKIQDLDSTGNTGQVPYIEQVDVSANKGQLTFNTNFHTRNPAGNVVTGRSGLNCSTGQCTINASWNYNLADNALNLKHNNSFTQRNSPHTVGYSDFYFCLAPPKIIVNKLLDGSRVDADDQFRIELLRTDNNDFVEAFTTKGSDDVVTHNTTTVTTLTEGVNYTVSEHIINGNLLDYQTTYTCSNATTGTDVVFSSGEMPMNATGTLRTFAINNVSYGDEITCNVINTPSQYTFTGYVFNDNGGIAENNSANLDTNTKYDISSRFTGNTNYFNGVFDSSSEVGIETTAGLSVSLTDCKGNNISTVAPNSNPQTQLNSPLGQFKFTVSASAIANLTTKEVCLVQVEPDPWTFSVDTTPNLRKISLVAGKFDYKTDGSRNLDFGEVKANYASLVLRKAQFVNNCPSTLDYSASTLNTAGNTNPRTGFSESGISGSDLVPGQCIAYRIQAYNRGHINLQSIQIKDELQVTPVKSVFHLPFPVGLPNNINNNSNRLPNSEIMSNQFNLEAAPLSGNAPKATLYFNTKYGTTIDP